MDCISEIVASSILTVTLQKKNIRHYRNDPAIREALENYRTTLDDDALTVHLKTIAQSTTAKTLKDENINMVDDEEMEEESGMYVGICII